MRIDLIFIMALSPAYHQTQALCALFVRPFLFVAPQSAVVVAAYDLSGRLLQRRSAATANIQ
jgi:hypothetical protein